jgi:hypothetical protein
MVNQTLNTEKKKEKEKNNSEKIRNTHQERCENSEEGTKAKDNRVANSLIKHWLPIKETALSDAATLSLREMIVVA